MTIGLGDEVFVPSPHQFIANASCIIGHVARITINSYGVRYWIDAEVCSKEWPNYRAEIPFKPGDIRRNDIGGTPLSQLSGRPGRPGFGEFCRIARSWGYD